MKPKGSIILGGVDEYISAYSKDVQAKLSLMRAVIQEAAPNAMETVSYFEMPGYFYEGYNYNGMFAWFSYKKPYVRLHVIPPVIADHKEGLTGYKTTKSIVSFPVDEDIPTALLKKLVKASVCVMKKGKQ